jgi:hypothetical protein
MKKQKKSDKKNAMLDRSIIDRACHELVDDSFIDHGMSGIRYVATEIKRLADAYEKQNQTGKLI